MVQVQCQEEMNDELSDDDSYDYCDVYSVHSNSEQTASICSEVNGSVLTVPSVLLKDLDEAHAAAELAKIDSEKSVDGSLSAPNGPIETESKTSTNETKEKKKKKKASEKKKKEIAPAPSPAQMVSLSRTSNKKRRKQLKQMKKAQAAANAAKALSDTSCRKTGQASPSGLPKKTSGKKREGLKHWRHTLAPNKSYGK